MLVVRFLQLEWRHDGVIRAGADVRLRLPTHDSLRVRVSVAVMKGAPLLVIGWHGPAARVLWFPAARHQLITTSPYDSAR